MKILKSLFDVFKSNKCGIQENAKLTQIEYEEVKKLVNEARHSIKKAKRQKELLELMAHTMGGMVWIKRWDPIQEIYLYEFANLMLCERFFCCDPKCYVDCTSFVYGKSDVELLNFYREETGKQHTYGDICYSTDIHATEQAIIHFNSGGKLGMASCRYIEAGLIDGNAVVLDVIKTPLFLEDTKPCWSTHTYSVGNATDASLCCDSVLKRAAYLVSKGQGEKLANGVYWIYPSPESGTLVEEEVNDGSEK